MATLFEISQGASVLNNRNYIYATIFLEIKKAEKYFIKAQKSQLSEGENNKGEVIGTYTEATENWERDYTPRQSKIAGQPYNFEDTGGFFDGIVLDVFDDNGLYAEFWSTDSKTQILVTEYKNLFGLQDTELFRLIRTLIYPALMVDVRKTLRIA